MKKVNLNEMEKERRAYYFYGVDAGRFKLNNHVYEAIEAEDDGYRSMMDDLHEVDGKGCVFSAEPLDIVLLRSTKHPNDEIWELVSPDDGHVWLEFGTRDYDDYYPMFVFEYAPRLSSKP